VSSSPAGRLNDDPVVVVGGGVIGLCIAYYLAEAGLPVELVERRTVGSGVSGGNAGWVCLSHSTPVPAPGVIRYALRSLGRPDSPLYLRPAPNLAFAQWLWGFWRASRPEAFRRGYLALAELNRPSFELYAGLVESGLDVGISRPGMVHAFLSAASARRHLAVQRMMAPGRYDVPDDVLLASDAQALDPALATGVQAGYLVPGEGVVDPGRLVRGLREVLAAAQVRVHENAEVTGFRQVGDSVHAVVTSTGEVACRAVVVAAGMASTRLLGLLGHGLPMQAGKGYSFSVALDPAPRHALYLGDRSVAVSPMGDTTRIAGTMELSGVNNRLDWRRIVAIARASRHYLGPWFNDPDDLIAAIRDPWVGGRPLLPDGLPLIDRLPARDNAYVATGHGMLGVTLAAATGKALAGFVSRGRRPEVLAPFGFDRLRPRSSRP
jgi:D-amino-acid dehydrogenase